MLFLAKKEMLLTQWSLSHNLWVFFQRWGVGTIVAPLREPWWMI